MKLQLSLFICSLICCSITANAQAPLTRSPATKGPSTVGEPGYGSTSASSRTSLHAPYRKEVPPVVKKTPKTEYIIVETPESSPPPKVYVVPAEGNQ